MEIKRFILTEQELISFEDEKLLLHLCRSAARLRANKQEVRSVDEAPLTGGGGQMSTERISAEINISFIYLRFT